MNAWPQYCPVCFAAPDEHCTTRSKISIVHSTRLKYEEGPWTEVYDRQHRELPEGKQFRAAPYRREV